MSQEVFAIGPLEGTSTDRGRIAYFLTPGRPDRPAVFGNSLAGIWDELVIPARRDRVTVESALAGEAKAIGVPSAPLSLEARALMAAIAFDLAVPGAFSKIGDDRQILSFASDFAAFHRTCNNGGQAEFAVRLWSGDGSFSDTTAVQIGGPGLVVLDSGLPATATGALETWSGTAAVAGPAEPAVLDALNRAADLTTLPQPFRLKDGAKSAISAAGIGTLSAALRAIVRLMSGSSASVREDIRIADTFGPAALELGRAP